LGQDINLSKLIYRKGSEKFEPKEAGLFSEYKIFGAEFRNFKDILEISRDLTEYICMIKITGNKDLFLFLILL